VKIPAVFLENPSSRPLARSLNAEHERIRIIIRETRHQFFNNREIGKMLGTLSHIVWMVVTDQELHKLCFCKRCFKSTQRNSKIDFVCGGEERKAREIGLQPAQL
jgi:hypothetical protein